MFLDLALNKIAMCLWATLFCMPNVMLPSEGNDHFLPGLNGQLKGCNEKMFFKNLMINLLNDFIVKSNRTQKSVL